MQHPAPERYAGGIAAALSSEQIGGEMRVNLIRLCAIGLFYARHLVQFLFADNAAPVRGAYHLRVTLVVMLWATLAAVVHLMLRRRVNPPSMKFLTSLIDVLFITVVCSVGAGPRSPLVLLYLIVIASTPLRSSLKLVYVTTAAAILGYAFLLGHYAWYLVGFDRYYATPDVRVPREQQAIVLLSLLAAGVMAGQAVRQLRRLLAGVANITGISASRGPGG